MGTPIEKSEDTFSVALTVVKITQKYKEDSYDKTTTPLMKVETQLASVDISGSNWEALKAKLHAHIDLV